MVPVPREVERITSGSPSFTIGAPNSIFSRSPALSTPSHALQSAAGGVCGSPRQYLRRQQRRPLRQRAASASAGCNRGSGQQRQRPQQQQQHLHQRAATATAALFAPQKPHLRSGTRTRSSGTRRCPSGTDVWSSGTRECPSGTRVSSSGTHVGSGWIWIFGGPCWLPVSDCSAWTTLDCLP